MAKLILSMDGLVLKEIPLNKERMSIGRKAHNDIQIENMAISGEHAAVVTILNDSFLEDLNSTNGTQVNGQAIRKHFLKDGDVIELGKYKMKYLSSGGEAMTESSDYRGRDFHTDSASFSVTAGSSAPQASPAGFSTPTLPIASIRLLSGSNAGRELQLHKSMTTLGKPGVQVAMIARRPQGYFLTHGEGKTLPTVNGHPIDPESHKLIDRDIIEIASVKMEFFFKG